MSWSAYAVCILRDEATAQDILAGSLEEVKLFAKVDGVERCLWHMLAVRMPSHLPHYSKGPPLLLTIDCCPTRVEMPRYVHSVVFEAVDGAWCRVFQNSLLSKILEGA